MIKKFLLLSLVASQLMISCSHDNDETTPEPQQSIEEQIAALLKQPYSDLTPAQQKVKLEAESNEMLNQFDKIKSSSATEAIANLNRLLDVGSVDILNGKNGNQVEDILNVSGVYGIYTWNNTAKVWAKTASTTELKFVFPAKASQTANNAVFSAKSVSSNVKVKYTDTEGTWSYNTKTNNWILEGYVNDYFFLPTSSDAILTIDNAQAATFTQIAKYSNGKQVPDEFACKMVLNDGYTWEASGAKAAQNNAKGSLTYNGKNLVDFVGGSTTEVDKLLDNNELVQYKGKANGLINLMDNFIIVADMDLAGEASDKEALYKNNPYTYYPDYQDPNSNFKTFYNSRNSRKLKISQGLAANFNKNMNLVLVSKKDGTKIATVVKHSQKESEYTLNLPVWVANEWSKTGGYWTTNGEGELISQSDFEEVYYLKFNDNTEVEMSVYFSEEFNTFEAKFEDFIALFNK
ncbi:hypothetical protein [Flavobacterium sp. 1355]|uniref:hypothetical protein n=1 Tax=Flavobacterium sp. 1355 TaxID=2806571 RepID=UPI001AEACF91|nr:hypothetical protein [Flavobacterium sp. 1355]MBP1225566.1 hypothetical protein [Flavobacterium sp. 1355]